MIKHAPGPWVVQGVEVVANHAGESVRVATAHGDHEPNWNGRMHIAALQANARLIAAAPDLLAALQDLLAATEETYDSRHEREAALDAIAKALGN
jgi:hypothetical protein